MPGTKILVLGGTGPAGICLLRELLHRKHEIVVYARSPAKIPEGLSSNPLMEVIQGDLNDTAALSTAVSKSSSIISLLGPNIKDKNIDTALYAKFFTSLFPIMRRHGVRRIFAMGTVSIKQPDDSFSAMRAAVIFTMSTFFSAPYKCVINVAEAFEKEGTGNGIDWTIYRIAQIPGEDDEASWKKDRSESSKDFAGMVGEKGWSMNQKRAALTRWLVDAAESGADKWIGKMPVVAAGTL
ncbi:hypothetical protein ACEPPN_000862 [Leptodophora sp. 'Broadleaf-Isolate-01']